MKCLKKFLFSVVDIFRKKENDAAVKIQSWFRGCQVRAYIRYIDFVMEPQIYHKNILLRKCNLFMWFLLQIIFYFTCNEVNKLYDVL